MYILIDVSSVHLTPASIIVGVHHRRRPSSSASSMRRQSSLILSSGFCGLGSSEFLFFFVPKSTQNPTGPHSTVEEQFCNALRGYLSVTDASKMIQHSSQGYEVQVWMLTWVMGAKICRLLDTNQNWCFSGATVRFLTGSTFNHELNHV